MEMTGTTGRIQLDAAGQRTNYELTVVEMSNDGFVELGKYNETTGFNLTVDHKKSLEQAIEILENKTLRVTVVLVGCVAWEQARVVPLCRRNHLSCTRRVRRHCRATTDTKDT